MALIEGFLLKKSYISYRPRYFELDGSNLLYKTSKEDAKERSLMALTGDSQLIEFRAKRGKIGKKVSMILNEILRPIHYDISS
jgi:hypothetical protein